MLDKRSWRIVRTFYTEPFFAYHHLNAYEDDGRVVVDIMTVPCQGERERFVASAYGSATA